MYKVNIKFATDGDFGWPFLPTDWTYFGAEDYSFSGNFETYDSLLEWADKNLPFLIEHVTGKYMIKDVKKSLTNLHNSIKKKKFPVDESWDGNYYGTSISCYEKLPSININIPVTDEFYHRFYGCKYISYGDIKEALEKLVEEKEKEMERREGKK